MKSVILIISYIFVLGNAFPAISPQVTAEGLREQRSLVKSSTSKRLFPDPLTTPIEVTGQHEFIAPGADDQRGPCPGLNALANHGYIGRDGVTSLIETTAAINKVWGMSLELGGLLAVMGTAFVGNPLSLEPGFSIGSKTGSSENVLSNVLGLVGTPRGLVGSHNIIEGDSSNTRQDIYQTGDASTMDLELFEAWYAMADAEGNFDMDIMATRANIRFQKSKATNPNFYYGPFTGMIARNAGYIFAGRLFANHSTANPEGVLTKEIIKSLFAVTGEPGNFTYTRGAERIPENWYRIPVDYGLVELNLDIVDWVTKYPELGSIGGNTGAVDSFTGVDLGDLTGGILDATTLLESNNLLCFVFEVVKTVAPNSLSSIFSALEIPLKLVTETLATSLLSLTCPAFKDLTVGGIGFADEVQTLFPGANSGLL